MIFKKKCFNIIKHKTATFHRMFQTYLIPIQERIKTFSLIVLSLSLAALISIYLLLDSGKSFPLVNIDDVKLNEFVR